MKYLLITTFAFIVGLSIFAIHQKVLFGYKAVPADKPIIFQANEQNKGERCEAVYYGLGNGDGIYHPRCFELQKQLSNAAGEGNAEKVKQLLYMGANTNATAGDWIYPLSVAAAKGDTEVARLLLDNGANVNHHKALGETPLMVAVYNEQIEMVEFLLSRGATVSLEGDGHTALEIAKKRNNKEITVLLENAWW